METLAIVGIVAVSILIYLFGMGYTYRFMDKHTRWDLEEEAVIGMFFWVFVLPPLLTWHYADAIPEFFKIMKKNKEKKKELPPIYIKNGAKIQTMEKYKQLRHLCDEFEIEFKSHEEVNKVLKQ